MNSKGTVLFEIQFSDFKARLENKTDRRVTFLSSANFAEMPCNGAVDVAFIIDSSRSISIQNFNKEKDFVKKAALKLGLAPEQSRAALVVFSASAKVEARFGDYPTLERFQAALDNLSHQLGGWTRIDKALITAAEVFQKARSDVHKVAMLLTDGKQRPENADLVTASEPLRKAGVQVIAVGITNDANRSELISVTQNEEDVIMAKDFEDLQDKLSSITSKACGKYQTSI